MVAVGGFVEGKVKVVEGGVGEGLGEGDLEREIFRRSSCGVGAASRPLMLLLEEVVRADALVMALRDAAAALVSAMVDADVEGSSSAASGASSGAGTD